MGPLVIVALSLVTAGVAIQLVMALTARHATDPAVECSEREPDS